MKALICYWGLVRGFKYTQTIESHKNNIWDVLIEQDIPYDVMLHTYNKEFDFNIFNINNLKYHVIEDDHIIHTRVLSKIKNIHLPVYFTEEHKTGLFKCWYSQQHLHDHIVPIKNEYDLIITLDIAQYFVTPIPNNIKYLDLNKMYLTDIEHFNGYNPRFCMSNVDNILFYLNKFNYVLSDENKIPDNMINSKYQEAYIDAYMYHFNTSRDNVKNIPNLHPEWQLKTYLDVVGKKEVEELSIKFWRIRSMGHLDGITDAEVKLYKVQTIPA
jgi:hypothetical protein